MRSPEWTCIIRVRQRPVLVGRSPWPPRHRDRQGARGRPGERLSGVGSRPLRTRALRRAQRAYDGKTVPGTFNRLNPEISLSCLLTPHPLQVRAGRNQLESLLVTMTDGELLHAGGLGSTCRGASHAVRAWRGALLYFQVRELSGEAPVCAVLLPKPLNLFLTFLPVHPCCPWCLGDSET
jgi:hypothetical protein